MSYRSLATIAALSIIFLLSPSATAQSLTKQSGCKARVKKSVPDPTQQLKLYRWPNTKDGSVRDLSLNQPIHLYTEFKDPQGLFYLSYVCTNPKVRCSPKDNDNANNPIVGFVLKNTVDKGRCFRDHSHSKPEPVARGKYYVIAPDVTSIFLRDPDNRNHPIGLLRGPNPAGGEPAGCFVLKTKVKNGKQFRGWGFSKGINPSFRYGNVVPVINGRRYLVPSPSKCY